MPKTFRRAQILLGALILLATVSACSSAEDRAHSYYSSGVDLAAKGELAKAVVEFRNALRLKSDYSEALLALGDADQRLGDYADAAKTYLAVVEQFPKNVESRVRLAYLLLAGDQLDVASKYSDQANLLAPDDPTVLVMRSAIALKNGNDQDAVALAKAALGKDPGLVDALMVLASERLSHSDAAGALAYLDQAPADSDRNVGLQVLRLTALDTKGDDQQVEALFKKLVSFFPGTQAFRQGLVQWYLSKNRKDDAEAVLRQYALDNASDDQAELLFVGFLNSQRDATAAIGELQRAIAARQPGTGFALQMVMAQLQFSSGQQAAAQVLMQDVIAHANDVAQRGTARVQLAKMLATKGDTDTASSLVNAVLSEDAGNIDALSVRASIELLGGKTQDATQDLLSAINEAPDNAALHGGLAEAYDKQGSVTLAEEEYAKALELDHQSPQSGLPYVRFLLRYGKLDQAERILEAVRAQAPSDRDALNLLAEVKLTKQDWLGAQQIADLLHQLDKGNADTSADRIQAAALGGLNRYSDSISLLQSTLASSNTNQAEVLADLIGTYVRAGKQQAAIDYLKSVVSTDPKNVEALILLASVYAVQNQLDLAEAAFKNAAGVDTGVQADVALAQFYVTTGNLDAANAAIASGLQRDDTSTALHLLRAGIDERTSHFDEAIAEYEALFAGDPTSPIVANDLASLLSERRGDPASLQRAADIAQRLQGAQVPQYMDTLGWIDYRQGDYASALPLLKAAAALLKEVGLVQYHLGMTLKQLGQVDAARTALQAALAASPALSADDAGAVRSAIAALEPTPSSSSVEVGNGT